MIRSYDRKESGTSVSITINGELGDLLVKRNLLVDKVCIISWCNVLLLRALAKEAC